MAAVDIAHRHRLQPLDGAIDDSRLDRSDMTRFDAKAFPIGNQGQHCMVDAEDPCMPLSDVALTQQLASNGILLARRTVSKYRGQLRVPPAELRRQH